LDDWGDGYEKCEDLAKCERELVFVGVQHPYFYAGYPVQERDDYDRDEVNEWKVFAHDRQDLPEIKTIGFTPWPNDVPFEEDRDGPGKKD